MPAFWISIGLLSLTQGTIVALAGVLDAQWLKERAGSRLWALVPPASVIVFVLAGRIAASVSATGLTYLALVAVPLLAALALGWLMRGARPRNAILAIGLFVLAWADRGGLAGQAGALALSSLSCIALGVLLAAVTPARWLALGIVVMAIADSALVISDLLQAPNDALNGAHPAAGLPVLQSAVFGSALMGYGDLFIAAALGGLLAAHRDRVSQLRGAGTVALLAVSFDLLFFFVDELPATVPVALALLAVETARRYSSRQAPMGTTIRSSASAREP
jgi:hypothetical protein